MLSILRSDPTPASAQALTLAIVDLSISNPASADILTSTLNAFLALPSTQHMIIQDPEEVEDIQALPVALYIALIEHVTDALHATAINVSPDTSIAPTNPSLAAAVLSASAIKNGVLNCASPVYAFARQGLRFPDSDVDKERAEVVSVGMCLQLCVAGKVMMDEWLSESDGKERVLDALKALREKKAIRFGRGVDLLERTISSAENGFENSFSSTEIWNFLFPV